MYYYTWTIKHIFMTINKRDPWSVPQVHWQQQVPWGYPVHTAQLGQGQDHKPHSPDLQPQSRVQQGHTASVRCWRYRSALSESLPSWYEVNIAVFRFIKVIIQPVHLACLIKLRHNRIHLETGDLFTEPLPYHYPSVQLTRQEELECLSGALTFIHQGQH